MELTAAFPKGGIVLGLAGAGILGAVVTFLGAGLTGGVFWAWKLFTSWTLLPLDTPLLFLLLPFLLFWPLTFFPFPFLRLSFLLTGGDFGLEVGFGLGLTKSGLLVGALGLASEGLGLLGLPLTALLFCCTFWCVVLQFVNHKEGW